MNRTFIISVFFVTLIFLGTLSATNHYVDKDATGSNNGSSWANAWQSFSSISWGSVNPGDVIYVSGGSSSKTYFETLNIGAAGSNGNNIVITKGIDAGHNGEVIIDGGNSRAHCVDFSPEDDYVTVSYFTMKNPSADVIDMEGNWGGSYGNYNHQNPIVGSSIEHCKLYLNNDRGIWIKGTSRCSTYRNFMITPTSGGQTDGIFSQASSYNVYDGDSIIIRNTSSSPHCDGIQINQDTSITVRNCYIEQDNSKGSNAQGIYTTESFGTFIYYNNVVNLTKSTSNAITHRNLSIGNGKVEIYGNVVFAENGADHAIWCSEQNTPPIVKNNIVRSLSGAFGTIIITGSGTSGVSHNAITGGNSVGSNVITSNPLFTNESAKIFTLQSNSPAIDAGTDVGSPYNVDKNGSQRPQGNGWDMGAYENYSGPDLTPPQLQSAAINNPTQLILSFSESLNSQSAQNASNYNIDNGISVLSATLSSNNRDVTLNTSEHTPNQLYTVIVSNVTDLAGNTISSQANSAQYLLEADTTPPEVSSAQLDNVNTLVVYFSEEVQSTSASNVSNYSINGGIQITNALLSGNNLSVQLSTSDHAVGQSYTVTVNNVLDLAGNPIAQQANSANYTWNGSNTLYRQNIAGAYANDWYLNYMPEKAIDGISDPNSESRWAGAIPMPDSILFDLGASRTFSKTRISFYFWNSGRIYEYTLKASNDLVNWQTVIGNVSSSNTEWSEETFSPVVGRYVLLVSLTNNQSQWAGVWEAEVWGPDQPSDVSTDTDIPADYQLNQNYPNPFNPTTNISFSLPEDSRVKITVYNLLGELVAEIVNSDFTSGSHTITFNADGFTSGIYLYRMETAGFIATKKMTLLR